MTKNGIDIKRLDKDCKGHPSLQRSDLFVIQGEFREPATFGGGMNTFIKSLLDFCRAAPAGLQIFDVSRQSGGGRLDASGAGRPRQSTA